MSANDNFTVKSNPEIAECSVNAETTDACNSESEVNKDGNTNKEPDHGNSASSDTTEQSPNSSKIDVLLKAAGDAPIMKKKKWSVDREKKVSWISEFIKKYVKLEPNQSMFLYINQSFSPSPDTDVGVLFDCFGSDGKLVLHYCRSQAWG